MKNFYVNIKPIEDERVYNYLGRFNNWFFIYGNFKVYKNELNQYQAQCPNKITLDIKSKKAYVLCQGSMILYGRIFDISVDQFKNETETLEYQIKLVKDIKQQIEDLNNKKKEIIMKCKSI